MSLPPNTIAAFGGFHVTWSPPLDTGTIWRGQLRISGINHDSVRFACPQVREVVRVVNEYIAEQSALAVSS